MSTAARIRPENLSPNAATLVCSTLRLKIQAFLNNPVFTRYERVKAKLSLVQCTDAGQLQRYYAGVVREREKREAAAGLAARYEQQPSGPVAVQTDNGPDDEAWQRELDDCDRDAA